MKKQFVAALATGIFLVGMTGMANATYIEELDLIKILDKDAYIVGEGSNTAWTHTYDFSEPNPLLWATLTIVADDVDPASDSNTTGEIDYVYIFVNDQRIMLGELKRGTEYSNWSYKPGYGAHPENLGLFVVSSGFEELLDRRSQQVDDADEGVIVSVSPGPAFGGLEDAVERLEASVAVA